MSLSSISIYGAQSGMCHNGSVAAFDAASRPIATLSSLLNIAGRSGPSATRAAPVSVAKSMISSALSSIALVSASASTNRPSASVLSISTVMPLRLLMISPGRMALPDMLFSAAATSICKRTGKCAAMISSASANACAAPPISFFIKRMPVEGLISSPPVSKVIPLPTIATRGWRGSPHSSSIRRGACSRAAALPTA